ncbi:S2-RNase [Pyrus ussuriensis x Pyrus communis]|uniref:S2-RNase n=1 Tax=Pyrus ussuriensis x Pyrus communis TaxID=2448454 RepID=A0A5N5GD46_9ROSA|nr:S2-RNase [Pyrus ussuriensis x Pyrus communis]
MIAKDVLQLASTFSRVKFIHASRLCNGVANRLAKFALSGSNNLVWFEEPPTLIQELLLQDICNSG